VGRFLGAGANGGETSVRSGEDDGRDGGEGYAGVESLRIDLMARFGGRPEWFRPCQTAFQPSSHSRALTRTVAGSVGANA
jgi:hypothetical protein